MGGGLSARLPALWRRLGERLAARRPAWARKLWAAAAGKGDAEAAFLLGEAIVNGHGAASHPANAARWYRQAAEDGHVRAQCRMAQLHLGGFTDAVLRDEALFAQAVEPQAPDYAAALPWARAAAATGDAEGQTLLGQILGNGPPELHDAAGSIEAYSAAAAQDFAPARLGYGIALMLRAWGTRIGRRPRRNWRRRRRLDWRRRVICWGCARKKGWGRPAMRIRPAPITLLPPRAA